MVSPGCCAKILEGINDDTKSIATAILESLKVILINKYCISFKSTALTKCFQMCHKDQMVFQCGKQNTQLLRFPKFTYL